MKKLVCLVLLISANLLVAQTSSQKASQQTCDCVKKIDKKKPMSQRKETAMKCMEDAMIANYEGMLSQYKIKEKNPEKAGQKLGERFGVELVSSCPDLIPYFLDSTATAEGTDLNTDTLKLDPKVCAQYKSGQYVSVQNYLNKRAIENPDATEYTEVKGTMVFSYSENGKKVTKWTINWISDCEWEQVFVESNDEKMKVVMKKGDKIVVKAIGSSGNNLWISTNMFGMELISLVKKK